jgi:hypothetical protein
MVIATMALRGTAVPAVNHRRDARATTVAARYNFAGLDSRVGKREPAMAQHCG